MRLETSAQTGRGDRTLNKNIGASERGGKTRGYPGRDSEKFLSKCSTVTAATFSPGSEPSGGDPEAAGSPGNLLSGTPPTGLTLGRDRSVTEGEIEREERLEDRNVRFSSRWLAH